MLKTLRNGLSNLRNKYNAKKVKADGVTFDSKDEFERYQILKILLGSRQIKNLEIHKRYWIYVNNTKAFQYEVDFVYEDHTGKTIAEDVKGLLLPLSKLKIKCFKLQYPEITFVLIHKGIKVDKL